MKFDYKKDIPQSYVLFYLLIFGYFIFGSYLTWKFIDNYRDLQGRSGIIYLYVSQDKLLFLKSIFSSLISIMFFSLFLFKTTSKNTLIKYISILFFLSFFTIFLVKLKFFSNNISFSQIEKIIYFLFYILFASKLAIQNFTIWAVCLLVMFPIRYDMVIFSKLKKSLIIFIGIMVCFIIPIFIFPQYFVGHLSSVNYF